MLGLETSKIQNTVYKQETLIGSIVPYSKKKNRGNMPLFFFLHK